MFYFSIEFYNLQIKNVFIFFRKLKKKMGQIKDNDNNNEEEFNSKEFFRVMFMTIILFIIIGCKLYSGAAIS